MPQLTVATNDNRIYITIPLDCIGNPSKGVNLVVQTASWATPYTLLWSNGFLLNVGVQERVNQTSPNTLD